jgi:hypothetical protein
MANMSFFDAPKDRDANRKMTVCDVWMAASTIILMIAYMMIRVRISNYVYVLRWLDGILTMGLSH